MVSLGVLSNELLKKFRTKSLKYVAHGIRGGTPEVLKESLEKFFNESLTKFH